VRGFPYLVDVCTISAGSWVIPPRSAIPSALTSVAFDIAHSHAAFINLASSLALLKQVAGGLVLDSSSLVSRFSAYVWATMGSGLSGRRYLSVLSMDILECLSRASIFNVRGLTVC